MFSKKIYHLRRSLCPYHILSSHVFKHFYVKLHKMYYFAYMQLVSTHLSRTGTKQWCAEHVLRILRITLETTLSYKRKLEVANFLRAFRNSYTHSHFSEVYFIAFLSIVCRLSYIFFAVLLTYHDPFCVFANCLPAVVRPPSYLVQWHTLEA
jgi:hypothetical protein